MLFNGLFARVFQPRIIGGGSKFTNLNFALPNDHIFHPLHDKKEFAQMPAMKLKHFWRKKIMVEIGSYLFAPFLVLWHFPL